MISEGSKKKVKWTTEEDQELRDLYEKYNDSGGENTHMTFVICLVGRCCDVQIYVLSVQDIVETLIPLLSSTRTRREVVSQIVVLGLVDSVKDLKKERCNSNVKSVI